MLNLTEILNLKGLDLSKKIKLVRHKDNKLDLYRLYLNDQLDIYQSSQSSPVFSDCDQIISFIGLDGTKAKFIGVYDVLGCESGLNYQYPKSFLYKDTSVGEYIYKLKKDERFEFLAGRLVIDWGKAALSWHQWLDGKEKKIIEILPMGYVNEFPGYLNFVLSYKELKKIIENPDANSKWHQMLSAVAGVYLIIDSQTGKQYIGSAYGKEGILGRWKTYAKCGGGENKQLELLLVDDPDYAENFRFSILQTVSASLTKTEVINVENLYKVKLGSRAFGLNSN